MDVQEVQRLTNLSTSLIEELYGCLSLKDLRKLGTSNLIDIAENFRSDGMLVITEYVSQLETFCVELRQISSSNDPYKAADIISMKRTELEVWIPTFTEFICDHQDYLTERFKFAEKMESVGENEELLVEIKRILGTLDSRMVIGLSTKLKDIHFVTNLMRETIEYIPRKVTKAVSYPGIN